MAIIDKHPDVADYIVEMSLPEIRARGGIAIVVAKNGLYQYDYSNPSNLKLLSKISMGL